MLKFNIPYTSDSASLFARIAHLPWAVFLDSGKPASQYGRYDVMAANPFMTLTTQGKSTEIWQRNDIKHSQDDPFSILKHVLQTYPATKSTHIFEGGAIGYFGYDLARRVERLPETATDAEHIPEMMIGIYDWALVVDHREKTACLVSHGFDTQTQQDWPSMCALFESAQTAAASKPFEVHAEVTSNMSLASYESAFNRIKNYITEGDCYQVNLAQRFSAPAKGDAWQAYLQLRKISPAPFMAYMNLPQLQVLSASPERFLQVVGDHVETRPIKGTRPRANEATLDAQNAKELQTSLKDRAENLMIVDLLRNDISRSCTQVRADRLFALESFANVHHLVSTVTGKLAPNMTSIDLLRGCFPGGSITGAPKLRSMQIIEELEPNRRGLYCGAIGYIGFDGNMDTNITIRTAIYSNNEIRFYAGGGIVADSEMQKEYRETWDKASSMLSLVKHFLSPSK